ncbi:transcription termination factor 2 isoform X1 [Cimex lectularius]|uniref:Transcription termination factor 2 n=2 Tax=Cimex lectularius TaxID=79782 RepID=A0A8I6SCJ1_CIMLE|nr:transcription termination factor 2 isoform X1 [Cimex lectularius]XP_014260370.1 transcription termination factor 2 isoform X1 [Cimex lectularius]XP_024080772.1 transcription termination factor 2 isoform X1 [Cimex lectularius]XP_024080773.1 transcription termination factor 2 isoform X1 [Cimex lectularius]
MSNLSSKDLLTSDESIIEPSFIEQTKKSHTNFAIVEESSDESIDLSSEFIAFKEKSNNSTQNLEFEESSYESEFLSPIKNEDNNRSGKRLNRSICRVLSEEPSTSGVCNTPEQISKRLDNSSSAVKHKRDLISTRSESDDEWVPISTWKSNSIHKPFDSSSVKISDDDSDEFQPQFTPKHKNNILLSSFDDSDAKDENYNEQSDKDSNLSASPNSNEEEGGCTIMVGSEDSDVSDSEDITEEISKTAKAQHKKSVNESADSSSKFSLLTDGYDVEIDNLSESRLSELNSERTRLNHDKIANEEKLKELKACVSKINQNSLRDGGFKLHNSIKKTVECLQEIDARIKKLNSILGSHRFESSKGNYTVQPPIHQPIDPGKEKMMETKKASPAYVKNAEVSPDSSYKDDHKNKSSSYFNKLPSSNVNVNEMGKKALQTHRTQQTLTIDALTKLHKSLETCPEEKDSIEGPKSLKVVLLPHQKQALTWMLWRESQTPRGGILADDMGLGKTLSILSLILKSKELKVDQDCYSDDSDLDDHQNNLSTKFPHGETLVVCPSSVMGQWESEVRTKIKAGTISVLTYHGAKRETNPRRIARYGIVLTTYSLVQKQPKDGPLFSILWNRVILDEAHVIRNHKSQTAQSIFNLKRRNAWALTGTPIHNKELDFYALLKFIKCKPFNDLAVWKKWVDNKDAAGINRLNLITKSVMLRRTKAGIQSAGGLESLKAKNYLDIRVKLDSEEYQVYEKVAHFSRTVLASFIHQRAEKEDLLKGGIPSGKAAKHLMSLPREDNPFKDHPELARLHRNMLTMGDKIHSHEIMVLLLRLRQICCHPCLAASILDKEDINEHDGIETENNSQSDLVDKLMNLTISNDEDKTGSKQLSINNPVFSRKRISSKIRAVIECLMDIYTSNEEDKMIVVSQWTSMLELIGGVLKDQEIPTVSLNGKVLVKDRMPIVEKFNRVNSKPRVLLLSLTAGGTGLNLIGANHLLLVDIHWNPQLESQASDRIYRVGQTKKVHIYKFICMDTIEERIEQLQHQKLEIAQGVLTGSVKAQSNKLTLSDLKLLFNVV